MKVTDDINAAIDRAIQAASGEPIETRQPIAVYWLDDQDVPHMVVNPDILADKDPELYVKYLLSGRASLDAWGHVKLLSKRYRSRLPAKPIYTASDGTVVDENRMAAEVQGSTL